MRIVDLRASRQAWLAVHGLALLAEAENETVANSATSEFLQRFSIFFSATAVPYAVRVQVLDTLLVSDSDEVRRLAFRGLARVASRGGVRTHRTPVTRDLPEPEWQPMPGDEHVGAALLGIARMRAVVERHEPAIAGIAAAVVGQLKMFLLEELVRTEAIELMGATARVFPAQREALRRSVAELLNRDRKVLAPPWA